MFWFDKKADRWVEMVVHHFGDWKNTLEENNKLLYLVCMCKVSYIPIVWVTTVSCES